MKRRLDFIYIDSGGGHRAAASALSEVIGQQGRDWEIRMLSIQDLLEEIDFIRKSTGIEFEEVYNIILRHGWTIVTGPLLPVAHALIHASHHAQVQVLEKYWREDPPDMVVSLIPHYNRAMRQAFATVRPGAPYVTILTDVADYPPHFWIERQEQHVICGSDRAVLQARSIGLEDRQIRRASGLIVNPRFYRPFESDRAEERKRLGLHPERPTGLVLFGGEGSMEIPKIATLIEQSPLDVQLILLCGRHAQAAEAARALPQRTPIFVEGFTKEIPYYMALSDFLIGKPGPGCLSEAALMGLPAIVERNAWTLPQERYNTEWLEERDTGIVVKNFSQIVKAVERLTEPERLARCRRAVSAIRNHAVFEIPEMLDDILIHHGNIPAMAAGHITGPILHGTNS